MIYTLLRDLMATGKYPCLYHVDDLDDGCFLVTDSAGRKRYIVGRLDNGDPFCKRAPQLED